MYSRKFARATRLRVPGSTFWVGIVQSDVQRPISFLARYCITGSKAANSSHSMAIAAALGPLFFSSEGLCPSGEGHSASEEKTRVATFGSTVELSHKESPTTLSDSVYTVGSTLESALKDPSITVSRVTFTKAEDNLDLPHDNDPALEGSAASLESWDDLLAAVEDVDASGSPDDDQSKEDQESLSKLLLAEGNHVSDDITTRKLVLAVIPGLSMASKTVSRIRGDKAEKHSFVISHLLVQSGIQPDNQLCDRQYRSIDKTEYSWPSTGRRRLVRRGNTPFFFGRTDDAVESPHGKKVKAIYLECEKVLG